MEVVALVLFIIVETIYSILKKRYEKTIVLTSYDLELNGFKFTISVKKYRKLHFAVKRRYYTTIDIYGTKNLFNIFLDSHYKDKFLYATEFTMYKQNQRVSLEGDFDKYFQLYAPKGLEREALELITPDVMLILRDELVIADLLISGSSIRIKTNSDFEVEKFTLSLNKLLQKIARYYSSVSKDDEINYGNNLLNFEKNNEAVKFGSKLISAEKIMYVGIYFLPTLFFVLVFGLINLGGAKGTLSINEIIMGLIYAQIIGFIAVIYLKYSDRKSK